MSTSAAMTSDRVSRTETRKKKKTAKRESSFRITSLLLAILMAAGLGLLLYPTVADQWNKIHATRSIASYLEQTALLDEEEVERLLSEAKQYNRELVDHPLGGTLSPEQEARYRSMLAVTDSDIFSYVQIKKIDCELPIYYGADDEVLQVGIGHLSWSSLPVGAASYDEETGELKDPDDGAHTIISGHSGLPSARLFTDIVKLEEGDVFALVTLNNIFVYEVDQIRIVLPEDLSELRIEKGQDYCTLVTCTPYGINSHRLLVRGHRIPYDESMWRTYIIQGNATQIAPAIVALFLAAPLLAFLFALVMILPGRKFRKKYEIDENIMEELEIAELPLYRLDLSVMEINRLMRSGSEPKDSPDTEEINP